MIKQGHSFKAPPLSMTVLGKAFNAGVLGRHFRFKAQLQLKNEGKRATTRPYLTLLQPRGLPLERDVHLHTVGQLQSSGLFLTIPSLWITLKGAKQGTLKQMDSSDFSAWCVHMVHVQVNKHIIHTGLGQKSPFITLCFNF